VIRFSTPRPAAALAFLALAACGSANCGSPKALFKPPLHPSVESLYAPHQRGDRFFNPWAESDIGLFDLIRWRILSTNEYDAARKHPPDVPVVANDGSRLHAGGDDPSVTWIGHATLVVEDGGDTWITDPFFSDTLVLGKERLHPPGIPLDAIPTPLFSVVSHDHYDHLDLPTIEKLPAETVLCVPLGIGDLVRGPHHQRVAELDWWQSVHVGDWTLTLVPSQHMSRRGAFGNVTLWGGWVIEGHGRRYYFAGDTGYFHGFREIGRKFGPIDVAMLPIGAFAPRWFMQYVHMDPAQALQAFQDLGARYMIPMHWGTFDLSDEPLDEPPRALHAATAQHPDLEGRVRVLAIGETFDIPPTPGS